MASGVAWRRTAALAGLLAAFFGGGQAGLPVRPGACAAAGGPAACAAELRGSGCSRGNCPRPHSSEFPDPAAQPELCGVGSQAATGPRIRLCDPEGLLENSLRQGELARAVSALQAFEEDVGGSLSGPWGVNVGVAVVRETVEVLPTFASNVAAAWGLNNRSGVLVVLRLGTYPAVAATGGLEGTTWQNAVEVAAAPAVQDVRLAEAIAVSLDAVAKSVTIGSSFLSPIPSVKQALVLSKQTGFQDLEIYHNSCGDERCKELWLDEVRQVSDRFEKYYHEAMVLPAMNVVGRQAGGIRVLVLGAGDGGIVTQVLQYRSVERVVMVEIDADVTRISKEHFPRIASGLEDPRCELLHTDAIAWVSKHAEARSELFNVVVIDFTDEPVKGLWESNFFDNVRALLEPEGVLVQNIGTTYWPEHVRDMARYHSRAFEAVYPMHTTIPDYHAPYILMMSFASSTGDAMEVDWAYWQEQGIVADYYSAAMHEALFTVPADVLGVLGLPIPEIPERPVAFRKSTQLPSTPAEVENTEEKTLFETHTDYNHLEVRQGGTKCGLQAGPAGGCVKMFLGGRPTVSLYSNFKEEALGLTALTVLGERARKVLVLGGGSGVLVNFAIKFSAVERIVVVEIDAEVPRVARRFIPHLDRALSDSRVELVVADAFEWLSGCQEKFDLIFADMTDFLWELPGRSTRVPKTFAFYKKLRSQLTPHGLLVQDIGSTASHRRAARLLELHREAFSGGAVWPMSFSSLDGNIEYNRRVRAKLKLELDGVYERPPRFAVISSPTPMDPLEADWEAWRRARIRTAYYHPSLHRMLFVLPAELQRLLRAPVPASLDPAPDVRRHAEDDVQDQGALVFSYMMEAQSCLFDPLNSTAVVSSMLKELADIGKLTLLHEVTHQFTPQGVTSLLLVSESHLSLHSWPERGYAAIDVVSCVEMTSEMQVRFEAAVRAYLGCGNVRGQLTLRGLNTEELPQQ